MTAVRRGRIDDALWIDNDYSPASGATHSRVDDSSTGEVIAEVRQGTAVDVDSAYASAARAQRGWSSTDPAHRLDVVRRAAEILEQHAGSLADTLTSEVGTVASQSRSAQVGLGLGALRLSADAAERLLSPSGDSDAGTVLEPAGVVGAITPWNYPLFQVALKVAPAVLAGCAIVLKPPSAAPLTAYAFAEAFAEAGLPPGVLSVIAGPGGSVGSALAGHRSADFISFTGSVDAGRSVAVAAARVGTRTALELGGKSAAVVVDSGLVDDAVRATFASATANAGQTCAALTRLLVPEDELDRVEELAAQLIAAQVVGDPRDERSTIGPLATESQRDAVRDMIARARQTAGVRTVALGAVDGLDRGWYAPPAVFTATDPSVEIVQEEVFGPVLVIQPYRDLDQAVELAEGTRFGLVARVWTDDTARFDELARRMRVGGVIQSGRVTDWSAPFGGVKDSGYGRERGAHGVEEYLVVKSIQRSAA